MPPTPFGKFEGRVLAEWSEDGRTMKLEEDFAYIDVAGKRWLAPKGSAVDGASIPRTLWTIIGGPFEGPYRNASVVHDVGCRQRRELWEAVHRMFHDACRCGGVSSSKAKLLYWAVYNFGPRWSRPGEPQLFRMEVAEDQIDPQLFQQAVEYFDQHDPSLAEIPTLSRAGGPLDPDAVGRRNGAPRADD
jgi:hypothetical protein